MKNDLSTAILHIISLVLVIANKLLTKWLNFNQVGSTTLMAEQKLIEQTNCTYKKLYITETHFHNMSTTLANHSNTITTVTTRNALVRWVCVIVTRNIKFSPNHGGQIISTQQGITKPDRIISISYYCNNGEFQSSICSFNKTFSDLYLEISITSTRFNI